jgi:predicted transcriptional regulator
MSAEDNDLRTLVGEVAAAYFANSHVGVSEISTVIQQIAVSLAEIGEGGSTRAEAAAELPQAIKLTPAQIRKSVTTDALISFENGRPYKTLRRHLAVRGLTPEQYRDKWGLPRDYPMVTASYSAARSQMAKDLGLGNRRAEAAAPAAPTRRRRTASIPAA